MVQPHTMELYFQTNTRFGAFLNTIYDTSDEILESLDYYNRIISYTGSSAELRQEFEDVLELLYELGVEDRGINHIVDGAFSTVQMLELESMALLSIQDLLYTQQQLDTIQVDIMGRLQDTLQRGVLNRTITLPPMDFITPDLTWFDIMSGLVFMS